MNKESKKSVRKEDIPEQWRNAENAIENIKSIISRIHSYVSWSTNLSIAILGFLLAVLMQFRGNDISFDIVQAIIALLCLGIAILIGFYIKTKYEFITTINFVLKQFRTVMEFTEELLKKFEDKEVDLNDTFSEETIAEINNVINKSENNIITNFPYKLILVQSGLVIIALLLTSIIVVKYIFL